MATKFVGEDLILFDSVRKGASFPETFKAVTSKESLPFAYPVDYPENVFRVTETQHFDIIKAVDEETKRRTIESLKKRFQEILGYQETNYNQIQNIKLKNAELLIEKKEIAKKLEELTNVHS